MVHLPSLAGGFVFDDHYAILGDPYMRQGNPWLAFQLNLWDLSIHTNIESGYYRPVARLIPWCVYQLAGPQAWAFHLTNVVVHSLNCAMIAELGRQLFRSGQVGWVGGCLFALHPRHVEPLAWPTAITDLFCSCAGLGYLLLVRRAAQRGSPAWWLAGAFCLLLSALCKEAGLLMPGLALLGPLLDLPRGDRAHLRATLTGVFLTGLVAVLAYLYLRIEVSHTPWPDSQGMPFSSRLIQGVYVFSNLGLLAIWPFGYGLFRVPLLSATPAHWQWWLSLLALVVFLGLLAWSLRGRPWLAFVLLWWGYCVAPVLGVVSPIPSLLSDRHIYLAVAALTWSLGLLWERHPISRPFSLAAAALLCLLSWRQIWVWNDEVRLWSQSKQTCPYNTVPRLNLAWSLRERGDYQESLREYQELIRLGPEFSQAYLGMADVYEQLNRLPEAERVVALALQRNLEPRPKLLQRLGEILHQQKRYLEARDLLQESLRLAPNELSAHFALALALTELHDYASARREYELILRNYPRSQGARHNLPLLDLKEAQYRRGRGDLAGARQCLQRLLSRPGLDPALRRQAQEELAKT